MPHSEQQPDFNSDPRSNDRQKTQALSRDIEKLNNGMRVDFDQKLGELSDLLSRFKALIVTPSKNAANGNSALDATEQNPTDDQSNNKIHAASVTPIFNNTTDETGVDEVAGNSVPTDATSANLKDTSESPAPQAIKTTVTPGKFVSEPARFESGLYKLNSQLYRFRLELDQELEFREEPLHVHFQQESDLSQVLQQLSDKSSEKNPDN